MSVRQDLVGVLNGHSSRTLEGNGAIYERLNIWYYRNDEVAGIVTVLSGNEFSDVFYNVEDDGFYKWDISRDKLVPFSFSDSQKIYVEIYGTAASRPLTNAFTINILDVLDPLSIDPKSYFSLDASGNLTYDGPDAIYEIGYNATGTNITGGSRSTSENSIFINGVSQDKSERYSYHRTNGDGLDSCTYYGLFSLSDGDVITSRSREVAAPDTVHIVENRTSLIVKSL